MNSLVALSTSVAVLGAVATWLALGPLSGFFLIWAGFIAWGAYFALGGDINALKSLLICSLFGVFIAWITALLVIHIPLPIGSFSPPVWVGITVFLVVYASRFEALSTVPATVFGYASTFAYILEAGKLDAMSLGMMGIGNPAIVVAVSMIIGGIFGLLSNRLAGILDKGD